MIVAALCEHQNAEVANLKTPQHELLAVGIRRAAALGGPLPGEKLLALLKANQWAGLERLVDDYRKYHRLPRGLRSADQPRSRLLEDLDGTATELLEHRGAANIDDQGSSGMSYDLEIGKEQLSYDAGSRTLQRSPAASPKDLGVIVTLLEVAAFSLTTEPGAQFTFDQLVSDAREVGGQKFELDEKDLKIVLTKASFLKKVGKEYCLR
jgi:hypothetical protein